MRACASSNLCRCLIHDDGMFDEIDAEEARDLAADALLERYRGELCEFRSAVRQSAMKGETSCSIKDVLINVVQSFDFHVHIGPGSGLYVACWAYNCSDKRPLVHPTLVPQPRVRNDLAPVDGIRVPGLVRREYVKTTVAPVTISSSTVQPVLPSAPPLEGGPAVVAADTPV